jgi:hypothetical protein
MFVSPAGLGTKSGCAGEGQLQFTCHINYFFWKRCMHQLCVCDIVSLPSFNPAHLNLFEFVTLWILSDLYKSNSSILKLLMLDQIGCYLRYTYPYKHSELLFLSESKSSWFTTIQINIFRLQKYVQLLIKAEFAETNYVYEINFL